MPRFQLQPLDAPLPTVPQGPLSKLPRVDAPRAPTRYVEPSMPSVAASGGGQPRALRRPAVGGGDPAVQPTQAGSVAFVASAAAAKQGLYGFNIEELYDYDLPNIRAASTTLTAMVGRTVNPAAAARAAYVGAARRHQQAESELGEDASQLVDGLDEQISAAQQHAPESPHEDAGSQLKVRAGAGGRRAAGLSAGRRARQCPRRRIEWIRKRPAPAPAHAAPSSLERRARGA
jgi:hypothetical protein